MHDSARRSIIIPRMKRKHEESPARSRKVPTPVATCGKFSSSSAPVIGQVGRTQELPTMFKNNSDNHGLRRSSRKAALERRVWAEPRKERYPKLFSKGYNHAPKRGRPRKEPKQRDKGGSSLSPGSGKIAGGRGPVALSRRNEEAVLIPALHRSTPTNGSFIGEVPNKLKLLLKQPHRDVCGRVTGTSGGDISLSDVKTSPSVQEACNHSSEDELEEEGTLIVDDEVASLQGAVVDEVIKDYPQESRVVASPPLDSHYKPNFLMLGSYPNSSSPKCISDVKKNFEVSVCTPSDAVLECCTEARCGGAIHESKSRVVGSSEQCDGNDNQINPQRPSDDCDSQFAPHQNKDLTEDSGPKSYPKQRPSSPSSPQENMLRIDDGADEETEDDWDTQRTLENETWDTNLGLEGSKEVKDEASEADDDNHVSLSEALAKLVDSDESAHGAEHETVTIHPFMSEEVEEHTTKRTSATLTPLQPAIEILDKATEVDAATDEGMQLLETMDTKVSIQTLESNSPAVAFKLNVCNTMLSLSKNISGTKELPLSGRSTPLHSFPNANGNKTLTPNREKDIGNTDSSCSEENGQSSDSTGFHFTPSIKQPIPPLIKIASKSPGIRIPLKCSECPMRFCTVRSLLWHFGTHEPPAKGREKGEVLLEDLLASWDSPTLPISSVPVSGACQEKKTAPSSDPSQPKGVRGIMAAVPGENGNRDVILKVPIPRLNHRKSDTGSSLDLGSGFPEGVSQQPPPPCPLISSSSPPSSFSSTPSSPSSFPPSLSILPKPYPSNPETVIPPCPRASASRSTSTGTTSMTATTTTTSFLSRVKASPAHAPHLPGLEITPLPPSGSPPSSFISGTSISVVSPLRESSSLGANPPPAGSGLRPTLSSESTVTVVPVEKLGQLRQQIASGGINPRPPEISAPGRPFLQEKDGLVMINPNLGLRIVSGGSDPEGSGRLPCSDSLTILPQGKGAALRDETGGGPGAVPDILTIVPQSDPARQYTRHPTNTKPRPHLITAAGKMTPDASRVVELVLLPPSSEGEPSRGFDPQRTSPGEDSGSDDSEVESDEGGMVIDVREDEPPTMDPLSLCAVTMEDDESQGIRTPSAGASPSTRTTVGVGPLASLRPILPAVVLSSEGQGSSSSPLTHSLHEAGVQAMRRAVPRKKVDEEEYRRRKYVCPFCQKRFGWSTDLKRHVILHTGERPFKCKWCPITFTRKFLLQNHMKKIHSGLYKWSDLWE